MAIRLYLLVVVVSDVMILAFKLGMYQSSNPNSNVVTESDIFFGKSEI